MILIKEFVKIWDLNKNYTNICTTLMWKNYTVWVILSAMKTILLWEIYTLTFLVCIRRTTRFSKRHVKVTSSLWKIQHFFIQMSKKSFFGSISNVYKKCNDSEEWFSYILCKDKTNYLTGLGHTTNQQFYQQAFTAKKKK